MPYERTRIQRTFAGDRATMRRSLVEAFLEEAPGTGRGAGATRYTYVVDTSPSGHDIELYRPAQLNNGFDFTVRVPSLVVSDLRAPWCSVPRHDDLKGLLHQLASQDLARYAAVQDAIHKVWLCEPVGGELADLSTFVATATCPGANDCPADTVVLIAKWLFAEQDLTYWNQSGRAMLLRGLVDEGLMPADVLP